MDMNHQLSPNGPDCKACWKNETYNWGVCDHHTCELVTIQNSRSFRFEKPSGKMKLLFNTT